MEEPHRSAERTMVSGHSLVRTPAARSRSFGRCKAGLRVAAAVVFSGVLLGQNQALAQSTAPAAMPTAPAQTPPPPSPAADAPVDPYEGGPQSDTPRPLKRSRVAAVLAVTAGLSAQPDTAAACKRFQPSPADVSQYFARAQPVSWNAYLQQGDWSPCSAQGELRLKDGRLAQWRIQSFGLASLRIDGANHYFSCTKRCRITRLPPTAGELQGAMRTPAAAR